MVELLWLTIITTLCWLLVYCISIPNSICGPCLISILFLKFSLIFLQVTRVLYGIFMHALLGFIPSVPPLLYLMCSIVHPFLS